MAGAILTNVKHAVIGACITSMLGPPLSGILGLGVMTLLSDERPEASLGSVAGLLAAAVLGGYLLAGLPAFVAGLTLVVARRIATPTVAASAVGMLCMTLYFRTLGSHLLPQALPDPPALLISLCGFLGTSIAARAALAVMQTDR